jgi:hypothetical protein
LTCSSAPTLPDRRPLVPFVGYAGGAAAMANFIHQQTPFLTGDAYNFDHGANLANAAIILVSVVAILTSNALEEMELKIQNAPLLPNEYPHADKMQS